MAQVARVEKKIWIPEVSNKRIQELAERIKPVIRFARGAEGLFRSADGHPYNIKLVDLFDVAYTWDPKPTDKVNGLRPICDIRTYHTYGYYGVFKPLIAEVLAQIPAEHVDSVVAFEIVDAPETATDLDREQQALDAGYHVAMTRLYARK